MFLYFRKQNLEKISYIFLKGNFPYCSGTETPQKFLIFQKLNLSCVPRNKKFKKLLIFFEVTSPLEFFFFLYNYPYK